MCPSNNFVGIILLIFCIMPATSTRLIETIQHSIEWPKPVLTLKTAANPAYNLNMAF